MSKEYIAIYNKSLLWRGEIFALIREVKEHGLHIEPYVFEVENCKRVDIDWRGDVDQVIEKLPESLLPAPKKRGRPKLGVVSKEVTLLPRHWEWLSKQRGGASTTLRRLVDSAIKNMSPAEQLHMQQNQLYNLMTVFGDEPGFEEASRALYRNDYNAFLQAIANWPEGVKSFIVEKYTAMVRTQQGDVRE